MWAKTLLATLALMLLAFTNAEYDVAKYCQLVTPNTKLPSLVSCQNFYTCQGTNQPIQGSCPTGTVFDKDSQNCVENDNCFYGLTNPCQNRNGVFVPSSTVCNEWHYCINGNIAGSGDCPAGEVLSFENQSCVYGQCGNTNNNNAGSSSINICQIMPSGQFFGDFDQCNEWHKCNGLNETNGTCLNNYVYDTTSGMCVPETPNICSRTGGVVSSGAPTGTCTENNIVGNKNICSVYYKCEANQWKMYQCNNQYFDVITKQCNSISLARPYPGCNRCQFTTGSLYWVNAVDPTCSTYLTCKNGVKLGNEMSCGLGNFFNEVLQYCMIGNYTLSQYAANNGACANYSCNNNTQECSLNNDDSANTNTTGTPSNTSSSTSSSTSSDISSSTSSSTSSSNSSSNSSDTSSTTSSDTSSSTSSDTSSSTTSSTSSDTSSSTSSDTSSSPTNSDK